MQRKIILLITIFILFVLGSIGIITYISIHRSIDHNLQSHLELAAMISRNMDDVIEQNVARLQDISSLGLSSLEDSDWIHLRKALQGAYRYSIFTDGLFLADRDANVVMTYPRRETSHVNLLGVPSVAEAVARNATVVSDIYTDPGTGRRVIFVIAPLKNARGDTIGMVGGEMSPANHLFASSIRAATSNREMLVDVVDSYGTIIASSSSERVLKNTDHDRFIGQLIKQKKNYVGVCHRCHASSAGKAPKEDDMLAFAPLQHAPWGVTIRDPWSVVFAPSENLKRSFLIIGVVVILASVILSLGLSKSLVKPLRFLTEAAGKISRGNLSDRIVVRRNDEIGVLAEGLDAMRQKLDESLGAITRHNLELESRVQERTLELNKRKRQLLALVNEAMGAQEEERRRIARELHDETSQTLAALGMSLDIAALALREHSLRPEMLDEMKQRVGMLVQGIHRIIQDLRPPVLDDLGIVSAINWLLQNSLAANGIAYEATIEGVEDLTLDPKQELRIFRVVQEAFVNIVRHSEAERVCFSMIASRGKLDLAIVDSGVGFDTEEAFEVARRDESLKGFGLLGMRERIEQLGGTFQIQSFPKEGTEIRISIPVERITLESNLRYYG